MTPEQERLFIMLKEVVEICDEHGIVYYVAGGTTLGAVRHGGFIPWDDDVDLMMPYEDWLRFVDIARNGGLPEGRVLSCQELDTDYPHVFGRYTDTTSCAIHYNQMLGGTPEGFIIDIFVLDPVPDAGESYQRHRQVLSLYNDLSNPLGYSYPMSEDRALLRCYDRRIAREGRAAVLGELYAQLSSHDPAECDYLVMRWAAAPRLFRKDIFSFDRWEPFEGLSVRVPGRCADYLVQHYGDDWMYVPPDGDRAVHDTISFLDVDYKAVQDDYLPFIDIERTRKAILNRRAHHIRQMDNLRRADETKARICAEFARTVTVERASACGLDLDEALAEARFDDVEAVFSEFYKWQNSADLEGREEYLSIYRYHHPVYADIGDDLLRVALANLVFTNRVGKAARIMRVRELAEGPLTDSALKAKRLIEASRLPASLDDLGCSEEAAELSGYLLEKYPQHFSNRVFNLGLRYRAGDFAGMRAIAEEGLERFPDAGEFLKYLADCEYGCDYGSDRDHDRDHDREAMGEGPDANGAQRAYSRALGHTTNALVVGEALAKAGACPSISTPDSKELLADASAEAIQTVPRKASHHAAAAIGRKTEQLLAELDDLLNALGVEHYLGPVTCELARLHGGNGPGLPVLDMLVRAADMPTVAKAIEGNAREARESGNAREGRALDCWLTNPNYLSYQIDYVDETTTFLQLDRGTDIAAHGVKVSILPIRPCAAGKRAQWLEELEAGWEANGYQLTKKVTGKRVAAAGKTRAHMLLGRKRLAERLFIGLSEAYGNGTATGPSCQVRIRCPEGGSFHCAVRHFEESESIAFAGRDYPAPSDVEGFLASCAGPDWERRAERLPAAFEGALVSADIPYGQLVGQLTVDGLAPNKLFSLMRRIRASMLPMAFDLRARNQAMLIARRSEDRKRCYHALEARRAEIRELHDARDYEQLGKALSDYEQKARHYLKHGLGLCPSKEYLDMLCEVLCAQGDESTAEKLTNLAPKEHYHPLL